MIRRHAREAYPHECCGAMIGRTDDDGVSVIEVLALPNVTAEGPRRRFRVSADDYRRAEERAAAIGAELLGFYHSHPDHPARPSEYDLDHAWPNFSYVIVAVDNGDPRDMRSWRLRPDRSGFEEEQIARAQEVRRNRSFPL
ncbi:MAG: M67 family metallopeptidase, partial [Vicinamibacterales bacterium]